MSGKASRMILNRFPCFLLVTGFWDISSGFPLAGGLRIFYANGEGKRQIQRQPLLVPYKQQAIHFNK
jgi:hypothetical protein